MLLAGTAAKSKAEWEQRNNQQTASYANPVFKAAPAASPTAAPVAAGGPVPLSTILYSSVPTVSCTPDRVQYVCLRDSGRNRKKA